MTGTEVDLGRGIEEVGQGHETVVMGAAGQEREDVTDIGLVAIVGRGTGSQGGETTRIGGEIGGVIFLVSRWWEWYVYDGRGGLNHILVAFTVC